MEPILKEFYALDPGYRSLAERDQIRIFHSWAVQEKLNHRLEFETLHLPRWLKVCSATLAFIYIFSILLDKGTEYTSYIFPFLIVTYLLLTKRVPCLKPSKTEIQQDTAPKLSGPVR